MNTVNRWSSKLRHDTFAFDRHAVVMATLFLIIQVAAVGLALWLNGLGVQSPQTPAAVSGPNGEATATTGAAWVVGEVLFAGGLLIGFYLYKRAPEWAQTTIKQVGIAGLLMYAGMLVRRPNALFAAALVGVGLLYLLDEFDVYWIFNNLVAVLLAIVGGVGIGMMFGVVPLLVAFVGFTIYDHYFANKKEWMFSLAEVMLRARLPVIFFVPKTIQWDWENFFEELEGGKKDTGQWGIGMADLMLPAAVAAAVAIAAPMGVVAGVIAGTVIACFRLRHELLTKGSGAGLPALAMGVIGGWTVATVLVGLPTIV